MCVSVCVVGASGMRVPDHQGSVAELLYVTSVMAVSCQVFPVGRKRTTDASEPQL